MLTPNGLGSRAGLGSFARPGFVQGFRPTRISCCINQVGTRFWSSDDEPMIQTKQRPEKPCSPLAAVHDVVIARHFELEGPTETALHGRKKIMAPVLHSTRSEFTTRSKLYAAHVVWLEASSVSTFDAM